MSQDRSSRGFKVGEGDWTCPGCGNVNFARRMQCNRCGDDKKLGVKRIKAGGIQIGKHAAEKSKGLFSADDWMCKTCGNVNWARRSDCNMCNTPKVGLQDERTGLGGGFNERENVEYKQRQVSDDDDEYDEFGRKRKKSVKNNNTVSSFSSVKEVISDSSDEDSDDEDGDLSKYDLEDDSEDDKNDDVSKYDLEASDSEEGTRSNSPTRKRRHSSRSPKSTDEVEKKSGRFSRSRSNSPICKNDRLL